MVMMSIMMMHKRVELNTQESYENRDGNHGSEEIGIDNSDSATHYINIVFKS